MTVLIINSIFTQSLFAATSQKGLKQIIDEFHYAVSVEWDQEDREFLALKKEEMIAAIQKSGLNTDNIIAEISTLLKKNSSKEAFASMVEQYELGLLKEKEVIEQIRNIVIADYANGASWAPPTGRDVLMFMAPIVIFAAIVAVIWALMPPASGTGTIDPNDPYYEPYCPFYCLWENQWMYGYSYWDGTLPGECYICANWQIMY